MGCGLSVVMHTVTNDIHRVKRVYGRDSLAYIDLNTLAERRFRSFSPGPDPAWNLMYAGRHRV